MAPVVGALLMPSDSEPGIEDSALLRAGRPKRSINKLRAQQLSDVGEIYLELASLDLDDVNAIFGFVRDYGVLGVAHDRFAMFRRLPGFDTHTLPTLAKSWPSAHYNQSEQTYLEGRGLTANSTLVETVDEFRLGVLCIRDLITATEIANREEPPESVEWLAADREAWEWRREELRDSGIELDTQGEAVQLVLIPLLSDGLRPFHPRVIQADTGPTDDWVPPLYSICCLELFNHLAEHAEHRRCALETCERTFVRQRGRAQQGQHRSHGVLYCSTHCARAQAQRSYRKRKRNARANSADQLSPPGAAPKPTTDR
jgi:hypothetical protein